MKKILILHILLSVFTLTCSAQMYSTSPYIQQRAGFSNHQENISNNQTLGYRNGGRIGYTTNSGNYEPLYVGGNHYSPSSAGPRKISFGGYTFWAIWGAEHNVPFSASNEDMFDYYDYVESGGQDSWNTWYANTHGGPSHPDDPMPTPIGEMPITVFIFLIIGYLCYKKRKTASV